MEIKVAITPAFAGMAVSQMTAANAGLGYLLIRAHRGSQGR